jgi:hypothetical protein
VVPYSNQYVVGVPFGVICPVTDAPVLATLVFELVATVGVLKVSGGVGTTGVVLVVFGVAGTTGFWVVV